MNVTHVEYAVNISIILAFDILGCAVTDPFSDGNLIISITSQGVSMLSPISCQVKQNLRFLDEVRSYDGVGMCVCVCVYVCI
jgi:hypothetical protein